MLQHEELQPLEAPRCRSVKTFIPVEKEGKVGEEGKEEEGERKREDSSTGRMLDAVSLQNWMMRRPLL